MRSRMTLALLCCSLAATALLAQNPEKPKPGPETKKLDAFLGKWSGVSEMKPGPFGPGGKFTSEDECTWFEGGWQVVCRGSGNGPMGPVKTEGILGWNGEEKTYKYLGFDSMGMMQTASGKVDGNTWTWTGEDRMGGKLIKSRYTIVKPTATTQTFKWETSEDGKTWTTMMEGKSTKK